MQSTTTSEKRLDDATLLARLGALVARDHRTTARLLWHLAEVDVRGLYRDEGYSSLFDYCVKGLHMSEGQAFLRIRAARLSRTFPVVLSKVESGELHLSALRALASVLTEDNQEALLKAATHKTKREVEEMLADMAPKPDVPDSVRKLPSARLSAQDSRTTGSSPSSAPLSPSSIEAPNLWSAVASGVDEAKHASDPSPAPERPTAPNPSSGGARAERRGETTPLGAQGGEQRYRVQFTADQQLHDQLCQAQDLLRHQVPDGDLATVVGKAMTMLVEQLKKQRFGHTTRPRGAKARSTSESKGNPKTRPESKAPPRPAKPSTQEAPQEVTRASASKPSSDRTPEPNERHIPADVRRKVVERDGARCTYVSDSGHRCEATGWLEFHHDDPFARGGPPTVGNIRLLCRAHNALMAERDFGRDFILGVRHGKRVSHRTVPEPSPG